MHTTYSKKNDTEFWSYVFNGAPENLAPNEQQALGLELGSRVEGLEHFLTSYYLGAPDSTPVNRGTRIIHDRYQATRGIQRWCLYCETTVGLCSAQDKCPSCGINGTWLK